MTSLNLGTKRKIVSSTPKNKKAKIGAKIVFTRSGKKIKGTIQTIYENIAIVKIKQDDAKFLKLENDLTVVAHKNYEVIGN